MTTNNNTPSKVLLPLIRKIVPNIIAQDLVGVQPMDVITVDVGMYEDETETFYVIFDKTNGDMELSSIDVFEKALLDTLKSHLNIKLSWVSDNDPPEFTTVVWYNGFGGEIFGRRSDDTLGLINSNSALITRAASTSDFPPTGNKGHLYLDSTAQEMYIWNGSAYLKAT